MSPPATWAGWSDRCGQVAASPPCMPATDWNPAGRAVHMVLQDQVPSTKGVYYQYQELASTRACVPEPSDTGLQEGRKQWASPSAQLKWRCTSLEGPDPEFYSTGVQTYWFTLLCYSGHPS